MAKQIKKKMKIRWIPILCFFVVFTAAALGFMKFAALPIQNIYVSGNHLFTDQEILELAAIDHYPSFYWTSSKSMKRRILGNPYIEDVTIQKKWFNQVMITITEYAPLFRKQSDQKIVLANEQELTDDAAIIDIPVLINHVPDVKYQSFIQNMNSIYSEVRSQISELLYDPNDQDKERFLLYMDDGNTVYLTLTKFKQINYYDEVIPQLEGKKGILYLDSGNHFKIME